MMVLTGPRGVGKSHLARAVGDDLEIRGYFDGGVHLIKVDDYVRTLNTASPDALYAK